MKKHINIDLFLGKDTSISNLKTKVYEEELKKINKEMPISENEIKINKIYTLKSLDHLEVGFFIRNGLNRKISFEKVNLVLQDEKENNVAFRTFDLKEYQPIPAFSATPYIVEFPLSEIADFDEKQNYTLMFAGMESTTVFKSAVTEIENISEELSFEDRKEIEDFSKNLPTLEVGQFSIAVFKLIKNENGDISIITLLRNGANTTAKLEELPITVVDENGLIVARTVLVNKDGIVSINARKSKLMTFEISKNDISKMDYKINNCKVIFKQ